MTSRAHLRTLGAGVVLAAAVLGATACGTSRAAAPGGAATAVLETTSSPPAAPEPSASAVGDETSADGSAPADASPSALLDGTRRVDVQLYTGQWLVPDVEGGLTAVDQPERAELPSSWVFTPVSSAGTQHLVVTEATTDGSPMCLNVVDVETVGLARCDPADPAQLVTVAELDVPEQVGISTALGTLVSGTDGRLAVAASPDEPNSVFTLVERGLSTRS